MHEEIIVCRMMLQIHDDGSKTQSFLRITSVMYQKVIEPAWRKQHLNAMIVVGPYLLDTVFRYFKLILLQNDNEKNCVKLKQARIIRRF